MCKFNPKNGNKRIDPCIKELVRFLKRQGYPIISCCCGHGKYPMTLIVKSSYSPIEELPYELLSRRFIPRKKRFYKRDKQGYYYIPELNKPDIIYGDIYGRLK